jgi:tetratricopeptide (TPR) repeat protein
MLKIAFLILCLTQFAFAQKLSLDQRRREILRIVDEELVEVTRLARQQEFKRPETLLRISELNLEKARHWREAENEKFLALSPEARRGANRANFYKQSSEYFDVANKSALVVVKRFPKYKGLDEVYYILAYNYKELGRHAEAQKYFQNSISRAPKNSKISAKAKIALAEYYYNDRKYDKAIPLYESSIGIADNERWWTKDAFNLAWSYYRRGNYQKAISMMKQVHKKSADPKFIDMRGVVERDIGLFYVDAGQMDEAIAFYEGLGLNYTDQFVKIASQITAQGRFKQAEALLTRAAKTEKNREKRVDILLAQLDLFDKFDKPAQHLAASQELVKLHKESPLTAEQLQTLTFQVNKKAAELQKQTASKTYATVQKVKDQKSVAAIAYFELAGQLTPGQMAEKTFFQAETAYAAGSYAKATNLYMKSFDAAKASNDKKILSQSIEGMLSTLSGNHLSEKSANKYYVPVYTRYLSVDSQSERANSIYLKLFNTQFDNKDIPAAEGTMAEFAKKFPKDYKTQEGMLARVMEHYRNQKNYDKVKFYVAKINDGEFKVSKKYADALRSLMTKIQIEGVQQSLEKGDKAAALKGYHQIFNAADSTPKARVNAAYNLSALYYELGDANQSYKWGTVALKDMEAGDVVKLSDSYLGIASGLFLRQNFNQSADLTHRVLAKICREKSENKPTAYKNAVFISLANNDLDKAAEIRNYGRDCGIPEPVVAEVTLELVKDFGKAKRWEAYEKYIKELETEPKNHPHLIKPYEDLRVEFVKLGSNAEAREIEGKQQRFLAEARKRKQEVPVEALDLMSNKLLSSVLDKKKRLEQITLRFPETEFNTGVKAKLQLLDQLSGDVANIEKLGSGKGIVEAYRYVITAYEDFGQELSDFAPEGKSPEYVSSFKKAMGDVYNPILQNARKQRNEVRKLIYENKILSMSNYTVLYSSLDGAKRYVTSKEAVLMDRGGRR